MEKPCLVIKLHNPVQMLQWDMEGARLLKLPKLRHLRHAMWEEEEGGELLEQEEDELLDQSEGEAGEDQVQDYVDWFLVLSDRYFCVISFRLHHP
jgi:hypothetical protein